MQTQPDVIIIGAGAAGLMCAAVAGGRGRRVVVLDHAAKPGEKIRISGGGRCNFTNIHASPAHYLSENPHFCVSALSRYTPRDFIALVEKHRIAYHEKTLGQLFCDGSSQQIIDLLLAECAAGGAEVRLACPIRSVRRADGRFVVEAEGGTLAAPALVVACGGLSIPRMGATGLGYDIARRFGHGVVPTVAALVPFTLSDADLAVFRGLSGVAVDAVVRCGKQSFREGMLFTHRGLSGPSMLQISSYWQPGEALTVNLAPDHDAAAFLQEAKTAHPRQEPATALSRILPKRLAQVLAGRAGPAARLADLPGQGLKTLACAVSAWQVTPAGTEGYRTAEVTKGGVDTAGLSSKTMESRTVPGLYFIGEVVDVTGHLGGFNFQWAWASGVAAGQSV